MKRAKGWLEVLLCGGLVLGILVELFAPTRWTTFFNAIVFSMSIVYILVLSRVPPEHQVTARSIWFVIILLILGLVFIVV